MSENVLKNEIAKRNYFNHCREADGFSEATISKYAQCIHKWQKCFENKNFTYFNKDQCSDFKAYLKQEAEKNSTGLSSQYDTLRHLKRFFTWLSDQKGYEKINRTDISYLRLSKSETKMALEKHDKEMPSLSEIKCIVNAIKPVNEVAMRDRALIAFLILTGMRIRAVTSLPMQSLDPIKLIITQTPSIGVKTKNSKKILSTFLPIDWKEGEKMVLEWHRYLQNIKLFGPQKPLFPAGSPFSLKDVSDIFWSSSNPARRMLQERCKEAGVTYYNPHSFRHAAVAYMSEKGLTEADKRSISLVLGHENIGTTFGSYGYGHISPKDAVERVKAMKDRIPDRLAITVTDEELGKIVRGALSGINSKS